MNKKRGILVVIIAIVLLIGIFGATYAFYSRTMIGGNNKLVTGDIYMHYKENNQLTITDALPRTTYDETKYFEFTINGKNTNTDNDIWYEIVLTHGTVPEEKKEDGVRIKDELLKFTLVETTGGVNEYVVNAKSYSKLDEGVRIWINTIPKNTNEDIERTYRLYMWISDETRIGNVEGADYDMDTWNNKLYGSIKVNVTGDFKEKELPKSATDTLIAKAGQDGLYGIDPVAGTICEANCKEYRYTGSTVKNYVKLTNINPSTNENQEELWRIIGIFTDEKTGEKYMRIVRNEGLSESYLPTSYVVGGTTYTIKNSGTNTYWNKNDSGSQLNNWEKAGLQYYLNTEKDSSGNKGYMSYLSSETNSLLKDRMHYLGTYIYDKDTAVSGYQHERDVLGCTENKGTISSSSNFPVSGCNVWNNNAATWTGKISLMYPSDYGFSGDKQYWTTAKLYGTSSASEGTYRDTTVNETSWMYTTMLDTKRTYSWMISPSHFESKQAMIWDFVGYVSVSDVSISSSNQFGYGYNVRPVLNLLSSVKIVGEGDGSIDKPYELGL